MDIEHMLVKPEDVILSIKNRGDLKNTFPIPDCAMCKQKCCPPGIELSIIDVSRFVEADLGDFITGDFEGYMDSVQSVAAGGRILRPTPRIISATPAAINCVFLEENGRCSIYEARPTICRAFPLSLFQDEDGNMSVRWMKQCHSYIISSDKATFQQLLDNALLACNEWIVNHLLMMHARDELEKTKAWKHLVPAREPDFDTAAPTQPAAFG